MRALLAPEENVQARRFLLPEHRRRFLARRGIRRDILSRYLRVAPEILKEELSPFGKPYLAPPFSASGLTFNASNSGVFALYAIALRRQLGVDIERVRHIPDAISIARGYFAPTEWQVLQRCPSSQRDTAFFRCWTAKEAYVKALGLGLSLPLDSFAVEFGPDQHAPRLAGQDGSLGASAGWHVQRLDPGQGYAGALVIEGTGLKISFWDWRVSPDRHFNCARKPSLNSIHMDAGEGC
jgi:4'-phosphopantetheinyl transferase